MQSELLRGRLLNGERVIWSGGPGQGLVLTRRDIFLVPFSLLWCGFAIFWTVGATGMGAPSFFTLWGTMFICVGLYFVAGRFLVDAWLRRGIEYAVTDRRVLIYRPAPFSKFTAMNLSQLPDVDLIERSDGSGTIRFGQVISMWGNRGMGAWSPSLDPTPQFIAIKDVRRVFDLVQQSTVSRP